MKSEPGAVATGSLSYLQDPVATAHGSDFVFDLIMYLTKR